jgi:hypothetical protein
VSDDLGLTNTRPRMSADEKSALLRQLLRVPELFDLAKDRLEVKHFDPEQEADLRVAWAAAVSAAKKYGQGRLPADPVAA